MSVNTSIALKMLENDSLYRKEGVTDDLQTIDRFRLKKWDYSLPTLESKTKMNRPAEFTLERFCKSLFSASPFLTEVGWANILLAGGKVVQHLFEEKRDCDFDFFIYGISDPEEATARAVEFLKFIHSRLSSKKSKQESKSGFSRFEVIQSTGSITVNINNIRIQVVLRLYKTISEILHGFDLGSSAVGFDGKQVYFTTLGMFCNGSRVNVVDTTRRSTTYERRLEKYWNRGFSIVVPYLDVSKLPIPTEIFTPREKRIFILYRMIVTIPDFDPKPDSEPKVDKNKIIVDTIEVVQRYDERNAPLDPVSTVSDYSADEIMQFVVPYINTATLVKCFKDENGKWTLPEGMNLVYYYSPKHGDPLDNVGSKLLYKKVLKSVLACYDEMNYRMLENITMNSVKLDDYQAGKYPEPLEKLALGLFGTNRVQYIKDLTKRSKERVTEIIKSFEEQSKTSTINWRIKNPGTQLTSSNNPIIANAQDWYGKYYLGPKSDKEDENNNLETSQVFDEEKYIIDRHVTSAFAAAENDKDKKNENSSESESEPEDEIDEDIEDIYGESEDKSNQSDDDDDKSRAEDEHLKQEDDDEKGDNDSQDGNADDHVEDPEDE